MTSLWSLLLQTIGASLTAVVLLCAKGLFREQLSPRWQYGVWGILALRILLPAGVLGHSPPGEQGAPQIGRAHV